MNTTDLGREDRATAARDVLGFFGYEGGWATGGFISSLILTYQKADSQNRDRLMLGFPTLGMALSILFVDGEHALKVWAGLK